MKRDNSSKHLSVLETICVVRECLDSIPQPTVSRGSTWSDCLLSELAVFSLNERTVRARNYNAQSVPEFRFSGLVGLL